MTVEVRRVDWPTLFHSLNPRWKALARRRFPGNETNAEIAETRVFDKLSANDWALLSRFDSRSAPATYLTSVYRNALEDVARTILGRCRPPRHIEQMGELWVAAFELLCCQRRLDGELAGLLNGHRPATTDIDAWDSELRCIARRIRGRVADCGRQLTTASVEQSEFDVPDGSGADPESEAEAKDADLLTHTLRELLTGSPARTAHKRLDDLRTALRALNLNPEAVMLARLVYLEQVPLSEAARALGLNERTARRRLEDLFQRLRVALAPYV